MSNVPGTGFPLCGGVKVDRGSKRSPCVSKDRVDVWVIFTGKAYANCSGKLF